MNIIKIDRNNQVNGVGLRDVIWCAGCNHDCFNCHNKEAQNPEIGTPMGPWVYEILSQDLAREEISGVTFSGGEATFPANRKDATELMAWIKKNYPKKTIWVYTGYLYEEIKDLPMMEYIDVLVDGKYVDGLNPGPSLLKWRGSSNQRVIDMPLTRELHEVRWIKDYNGKFLFENEKKNKE